MKKWQKNLVIALVILFAVGFLGNLILKTTISMVAGSVTGTKVSIGDLSVGIFSQSASLKNLIIYNPKGFSNGVLLKISKAGIKLDMPAFFQGKIHLRLAELDLKEVLIEKNKEGKFNVDALRPVQKETKQAEKSKSKPLAMQIDLLSLKIGRIIMKDYSAQGAGTVQVYDLNINESYKNITSAEQLVTLILSSSMKAAGIRGAAIYGVAMIAGAGILPVAVAAQLVGNDSAVKEISKPFNQVFDEFLALLNKKGKVTGSDKSGGSILADYQGASVSIKLNSLSSGKTQVTVSARKYMFPRPEIASGILYEYSPE